MKNYVQPGDVIGVTAPYNVASGAGCLVGSLFGIATTTVLSGAAVELVTRGVFDIAKATGAAWTQGARIYWDDSAKNATTNAAAGANKHIGVATQAQASGDTIGRLALTAAFTL